VLAVFFFAGLASVHAEIGEMARQRAKEVGETIVSNPITPDTVDQLFGTLQWLGIAVFSLLLVIVPLVANIMGFDPFKKLKSNEWNPRILILSALLILGLVIYYLIREWHLINIPGASEHAGEIDTLTLVTLVITVFVFFVTQFLLFFFAFRYRGGESRQALYYPVNDRLELLWTVIPAIALTVIISFGIRTWTRVMMTEPDEKPLEIEIVGEQFKWTVRYPGPDGKLGKYDFELIGGANVLGLDFSDPAAKDDIILSVPEIHLPVNKPVKVHIRSKDVLHAFYTPYFRAQMYAVPGTPTSFTFTPTVTTKKMSQHLGNPDFVYEVACNQLCGGGHYNMRATIVVEDEAEFQNWLEQQTPFFKPEMLSQSQ
jgi:cytochrome c oxidase subunit 2